jgi:hypothetical protein
MMRTKLKKLVPIILLLLTAGLNSSAIAQNRIWSEIKGKPLVQFDWNCASPSVHLGTRLSRIVKATMEKKKFVGAGTWGDRAFIFDLNGDEKLEYFVPLDCGGTGNCTWGVFALNPARLLGLAGGQYIYVHERAGRYPDLITYTHMSAAEGLLATYSFRKKGYVWLGDDYPIGPADRTLEIQDVSGNRMPRFLGKARAGCGKLGD